jgi:hypothetical protein
MAQTGRSHVRYVDPQRRYTVVLGPSWNAPFEALPHDGRARIETTHTRPSYGTVTLYGTPFQEIHVCMYFCEARPRSYNSKRRQTQFSLAAFLGGLGARDFRPIAGTRASRQAR